MYTVYTLYIVYCTGAESKSAELPGLFVHEVACGDPGCQLHRFGPGHQSCATTMLQSIIWAWWVHTLRHTTNRNSGAISAKRWVSGEKQLNADVRIEVWPVWAAQTSHRVGRCQVPVHLSAILAAKAAPSQCYTMATWVKRQIDWGFTDGTAGTMLTVSVADHFSLQAHLRSNTEYEVRVKEACSGLRKPRWDRRAL